MAVHEAVKAGFPHKNRQLQGAPAVRQGKSRALSDPA
jgi:hypothetical protein